MAKQLYFYCTAHDLVQMQEWFFEHQILLLRPCILQDSEAILDSLEDFITTRGWSLIYFTNPQFLNRTTYRLASSSGLKYVQPSEGYVIEFMRPQTDAVNQKIACSRLYAKTGIDSEFDYFVNTIYRRFAKKFLIKYKTGQANWATESAKIIINNDFKAVAHL